MISGLVANGPLSIQSVKVLGASGPGWALVRGIGALFGEREQWWYVGIEPDPTPSSTFLTGKKILCE